MKRIEIIMLILALGMTACGSVRVERETANILETSETTTFSENNGIESFSEEELMYITLEEAIEMSDCLFVGEYVETIGEGAYVEHKFRVLETLGGEIDDDIVYVFSTAGNVYVPEIGYKYERDTNCYVQGEKYLLVTAKNSSIMYEHDRYLPFADMVLCLSTEEYQMYGKKQNVELPVGKDIVEYAAEVYASSEHRTIEKRTVSYDDELSELIGESQYIAIVDVQELEFDSMYANSTAFRCIPQVVLKGEHINTYNDGDIILSVEKGTMKIGERYIVGFGSDSDTSLVYIQSVRDGVYPVNDELIEKISDIVQEKGN